MNLDGYDQTDRIAEGLDRALKAGTVKPYRDGTYEWDLGDRRWRSRAWTDPSGMIQVPVLPGIYRDAAGGIHFNIEELCRIVELEPTTENMLAVARVAGKAATLAGWHRGDVPR